MSIQNYSNKETGNKLRANPRKIYPFPGKENVISSCFQFPPETMINESPAKNRTNIPANST